ncbi:MAG: metalloregulator ArsR/SmtB family transcription factor [Paracoccaceae bacterium]
MAPDAHLFPETGVILGTFSGMIRLIDCYTNKIKQIPFYDCINMNIMYFRRMHKLHAPKIPPTTATIAGIIMTKRALPVEAQDLQAKLDVASGFLKKMSNPDRLLLACALLDGERSVSELEETLGIRQPGLSQQLAELRGAGLVAGRKEGKQVFYHIADPAVETFIHQIHRLFCT